MGATGVKMIPDLGGVEIFAKKCIVSATGFRNTSRLCGKGSSFPVWCALHAFPWGLRASLMRLLLPAGWWKYAGRTGEEVLNECFADAPESERENVLKAQGYLCGLFLDSGCMPQDVSFF